MDPLAALFYIVNASGVDSELVERAERIAAYQGWRACGGFKPIPQDHELVGRLGAWAAIAEYAEKHNIECDADRIVKHAANALRDTLKTKTGRDFGTRYFQSMLDAVEYALEHPFAAHTR